MVEVTQPDCRGLGMLPNSKGWAALDPFIYLKECPLLDDATRFRTVSQVKALA